MDEHTTFLVQGNGENPRMEAPSLGKIAGSPCNPCAFIAEKQNTDGLIWKCAKISEMNSSYLSPLQQKHC